MKFNSHPPNGVFIKAVTITASRQARPARLGPAQLCGYVLYEEGGGQGALWREGRKESVGMKERDPERMWRRTGAVSSKATEGLNLPKRQLSLLCNLTRTCSTSVWVRAL